MRPDNSPPRLSEAWEVLLMFLRLFALLAVWMVVFLFSAVGFLVFFAAGLIGYFALQNIRERLAGRRAG